MKLTLRLANATDTTQQSRTLEFGAREGGTLSIGRGADNDWVLADPDRTLSKNHCRIDASEGGFMLTDLSTNGVFLAGARQAIGRGHSAALEDGDSFTIGPYRMQAEIGGGVHERDNSGVSTAAAQPALAPSSPLIPEIEEPWLTGLPSGGFGPSRQPAMHGWDAPPDPATYAATGLFEQRESADRDRLPNSPFAPIPGLFSQQSEHIEAAATVMRLPKAQVVLPANWMEGEPAQPAPPPAEAASWPPELPEEPPQPEPLPTLPAAWAAPVTQTVEQEVLPPGWDSARPASQDAQLDTFDDIIPPERHPLRAPEPAAFEIQPQPPALASPDFDVPSQPLQAEPQEPAAFPAPSTEAEARAGAVAAFLDGAGLAADTLSGMDPNAAFRAIGQMVRTAVEGVRDIMSTRALVKSEFRVDQTVLRRADNNPVKFAPDTQRCLAAMVGASPPGFLPGAAAMQQSMDDIKLHELALVAALNSVFADMSQLLDPEAILRRAKQDSSLSAMLPYARDARCWAIFVENYRLLQDSGAANTGGSLLAPLAQAYARQLKRGR